MIRHYFCFFVFLFLLNTCKKNAVKLPLPMETAVELIIDVHSAEAALQNVYGRKKDSLAAIYYDQIYQIYQIDSLEFKKMIGALRDDPELMKEVYNRAIIQVEERANGGQ